ncbi:bacillithiol biosynthesis cysteine-adding enzyme BshC [Macrococcus hajekii]|uniref:Putative cysteine ligase BshC n=1 Tax=Macrococcus hajekii TaxID=198482 RepID=A0A4V3BEA9_9STAP|nr:bacillithiol biosynthesis cysteine-adding enzyme BshC [Macrococcus hajekii]TDM03285.1 bacillithiol biosynthesis cysteine-adding enzyme BshC [Macrococcus hajekii]GGA97593.1 putative cysteine ligase BshC [Macrococcus hajekii]
MNILTVKDDRQSFLGRYIAGDFKNYDYQLNEQEIYGRRHQQPAHPHTSELAAVIGDYMRDLELTELQRTHLSALASGAQVVIGGQQAGLFISPLYTIHKIISIIVHAREQSAALGSTIVPVFWIAGEDHDFSEVNHAYLYDNDKHRMQKLKVATKREAEDSVSHFSLTEDEMTATIEQFVSCLHETARTKVIYEKLIQLPMNWTAHFKALVHELFKDYGLILIDSADPALRKLEQETLLWMFDHHYEINEAFHQGQKEMDSYSIETTTNVHLFLSEEGKRQLLNYEEGRYHLGKSGISYSEEEIRTLIKNSPERFSNNVVTRPLMEELMFNTLTFIGGPAEVRYWGELHTVFKAAKREMPIVLPRMRLTYIDDRISKLVERYELPLAEVVTEGLDNQTDHFLQQDTNQSLVAELDKTSASLQQQYQQMMTLAESEQVKRMIESNLKHHLKQVDYFNKAYNKELHQRNRTVLNHFNEIEAFLHPRGGLQERTWHPLVMLNNYSMSLFDDVIESITYSLEHRIIEI